MLGHIEQYSKQLLPRIGLNMKTPGSLNTPKRESVSVHALRNIGHQLMHMHVKFCKYIEI
jgi:hypothetical protein